MNDSLPARAADSGAGALEDLAHPQRAALAGLSADAAHPLCASLASAHALAAMDASLASELAGLERWMHCLHEMADCCLAQQMFQ